VGGGGSNNEKICSVCAMYIIHTVAGIGQMLHTSTTELYGIMVKARRGEIDNCDGKEDGFEA
jgi:hypothetical protein